MRVLLQRVDSACVAVDGQTIGATSQGLLVFVGFGAGDTDEVVCRMVDKMLKLRIFADAAGKTNLSVLDVVGSVLVVSQFTLYANIKHGNRPSFGDACAPAEAERLYEYTITKLQEVLGESRVQSGSFGADMQVTLTTDGPFTIRLESAELI